VRGRGGAAPFVSLSTLVAMPDLDRARSALHAIDPGCPRTEWATVGMAAKDAGLALDDFIAWSKPARNFKNEADCRAAWRSFKRGEVTAATLFARALDAGWRDETTNEHDRPHQKAQERRKRNGDGKARFDFAAVWGDSEAAAADHPYIARKRGLADGLRVYRGTLKVAGQSLEGSLLVPVHDGDGRLQSWQAIPAEGDKRSAPGAPIKGGSFVVGGAVRDVVYVVEGIGQAWSAHQATGKTAVVCFGAGNVETIAKQIRERYPVTRIVIVADAGKERDAERVAKAVRGAWVAMPEGSPANFDLNDHHRQVRELSKVAELLAAERVPDDGDDAAALRFRFLTIGELLRTPAATWRVLRVIPSRGLVVIWGASGSGKTFTVLDLAGAIVRGLRWAGRRTKRGAVAYVAAEGQLRDRVEAYLQHNGLDGADLAGLRVLDSAVNLLDPTADIPALVESLRLVALETGGLATVIVDTLNRVMPGGDENNSDDMGMVLAAAKLIEREFGCAVIFVHHSGKDETKGSRGHSSLKAAADAEISVKRDGDVRTIKAEKVRDGADGEVLMTFRLRSIDLGAMADTDPDAEPDERRTSCVVESIAGETIERPSAPAGGNQRVAWDRIGELLREVGEVRPAGAPMAVPPGRPAVTLDAAADGVGTRLVCEPKRRRERAIQAIRGLVGRGLLRHAEGWIWCP